MIYPSPEELKAQLELVNQADYEKEYNRITSALKSFGTNEYVEVEPPSDIRIRKLLTNNIRHLIIESK